MVSAAPVQAPPARREGSRHPPFSVRASWRETLAFVGGLAAIVGAFAPWFHVRGTRQPLFQDPAPFEQTVWGGMVGGYVPAILCAFALAFSLVPLAYRVRLGVRFALFTLAALCVAGGAGYALMSLPMTEIFREIESVRPSWGLFLALGGSLGAATLTLSRLLEHRRKRSADAAAAGL